MSPPMSLLAKWRRGINEGGNHSEKDARNGTKTRSPDQFLGSQRLRMFFNEMMYGIIECLKIL